MADTGIKPTRIDLEGWPLPDEVSIDGDYTGDDVDWDSSPGMLGYDQWKQPVRCATTGAITIATALNAGDSLDGVTLAAGDRVLVKDQGGGGIENGIWIAGTTPARAPDMDEDAEVLGAVVHVIDGTANAGAIWYTTNDAATIVGTDAILWAQVASGTGSGITVQDEGTPLSTAATTLDFVGAGVTATGAGATKTITIPGGSGFDPGWFNVEDYGAVHDDATDDTAAIQAAIDACMTAGGGTVYFPQGTYLVAGALQDTGTYNSQLEIPVCVTYKSVTLRGSSRNQAMLRSDWNGTISGTPSVISAGTHNAVPANKVNVYWHDLGVIVHDDPKLTAIDMTNATSFRFTGLYVGSAAWPPALPTHSNAVGLDAPWGLNDGQSGGDELYVAGMYTAVRPSEQFELAILYAYYCVRAVEFNGQQGTPAYLRHMCQIEHIMAWNCVRGLVFAGDQRWVRIGLLDIEHGDAAPFTTVYDIDDPSNYARGFVGWHATDYTTGPEDNLLLNGATGLSFHGAYARRWTLNNVVDIPTGTNPSTNPANGRRLYTDSATGHLSARTSAGTVIDYEAVTSSARWEPVTTNPGGGPELVWDGDDIVMTWRTY